jgi:ribosomal protein S7
MARAHMSVKHYNLLRKYDSFLAVRADRLNKYYIMFLLFYKDYFVYKVVNNIMLAGNKQNAFRILRSSLSLLKKSLGFQPFFIFKHIVFKMRQIFKLNTVTVRQKVTYWPVFLHANKQLAYGIRQLVSNAYKLATEEHIEMHAALHIVFLNCFLKASLVSV